MIAFIYIFEEKKCITFLRTLYIFTVQILWGRKMRNFQSTVFAFSKPQLFIALCASTVGKIAVIWHILLGDLFPRTVFFCSTERKSNLIISFIALSLLAMFSMADQVMVFCYQNCCDLLWEKIVLVIEKKTFEIRGWNPRICKKIFKQWIVRTIFGTEYFFTPSWRFLIPDKL